MVYARGYFFLRRINRSLIFGLLALVLISVFSASAAANSVSGSSTADQSFAVDPNQLKPPECASLNLTGIVVGGAPSSSGDLILGTSGADNINGGQGDDCIVGGDGNDRINGQNGADIILGGAGNDDLKGGNDDDWIDGGDGDDSIDGGNGTDICNGGPGTDTFKKCETENQ